MRILKIEGPEGIGVILPETGNIGEEVVIENTFSKPLRIGDFWIYPGDSITIAWDGEHCRATKPFMAARHQE